MRDNSVLVDAVAGVAYLYEGYQDVAIPLLLLDWCLSIRLLMTEVFGLGVLYHGIVDGQPAQVGTQQKSTEQLLLCFVLDLLGLLETVRVLHLGG